MSNFNFNAPNNIGAIAPNSVFHGGQFTGSKISQRQNLSEAAAEIQALLVQLAQTYPNASDETLATEVVRQVNQKPQLKEKVMRALQEGGIEAFR